MTIRWVAYGPKDKGMIHTPYGTKQDREKLHHATQNSAQFKIYELFIPGIFHLMFLDHGQLWVTETADKQGLL